VGLPAGSAIAKIVISEAMQADVNQLATGTEGGALASHGTTSQLCSPLMLNLQGFSSTSASFSHAQGGKEKGFESAM
jgi:hypothetical protein